MSKYTVDEIIDNKHRCLGRYKKCGVYKITNLANNKIYIGSSKTILRRWRNHIRELNDNKHKNLFLQEDWNKYGKENFVFEILEECFESNRYEIEQKYLDELFPFYRSGNGYNISEKSTQRNECNVRLFNPKDGENYYIVKAKGCKRYIKLDKMHCDNTSREDLQEECISLDSYCDIRSDIIEQCGYDSWEWD